MDYYDSQGNIKLKLFFEEGIVTQVRVFLDSENPEISNKMLIISEKHFKQRITTYYQKSYRAGNTDFIEYYTNNVLESTFTTISNSSTKEIKGIGYNGVLFYHEIINYNINGAVLNSRTRVYNQDGTITMG